MNEAAGEARDQAPKDIARAASAAMWASDSASQRLGMTIDEIDAGHAVLRMTITESMTNGHGTAHGGFIFALADSAFAFACNSHGARAVASHCAITYLRPGYLGDKLVARAREVSRSGRNGIYDVSVSVGEHVIAEFRGHSRTIGGSWIETGNAS
ncbi:hydroxyphenylacetyl-CoA thioesterase PaaI [Acidiphilium sp. AL]|uniref:Hydroxyphenylacetyl-CoA thioesterase PaaI n=1 Tax=Acidiphilium iwatense TaxID=768198 RepID=A0ABS9DUW9_9PROT|nr:MULTISPECIES: hydroxyphenylacetyl-CoA thioesterase PaaI [Acidiphilium]MCF3946538.1 hydroxyphenylacetyl-CoA thioesterase PaaI [Acidiphilium iwatense]MCU4160281.1 hydroxyphenylacetyl-CoA thioesterase PaaI [Acidiphilium sp. AL]